VPGKHSQVSGPLRKGLGTSLQVQAPVRGPLIFFEVVPILRQKKRWFVVYLGRWRVVDHSPKSSHCGGRKDKLLVFSTKKPNFKPFFYPKLLRNTLETLLNQFMVFKNVENHPKTHNLPKTKNLPGPTSKF